MMSERLQKRLFQVDPVIPLGLNPLSECMKASSMRYPLCRMRSL